VPRAAGSQTPTVRLILVRRTGAPPPAPMMAPARLLAAAPAAAPAAAVAPAPAPAPARALFLVLAMPSVPSPWSYWNSELPAGWHYPE
jgi:hypothetical protein